jgi:hypothetical protein
MYPSWVPQNTRLACTPGTNKTNSFHSCREVQVPVQTWTPNPHTWDLVSMRCLDLHLSLPPISRSGKSRNTRQESNESSHSHKQVCARDNKSVTWLPSTATDGPQLTRTGKTVQPSYAPWPRDTTCYTHQYLYHIPTRSPFSFPSFYHECNTNITYLWVTVGYSRYR